MTQRPLASRWTFVGKPLFDSSTSGRTLVFAALVVALREDHELLEWIRQNRPKELDKLIRECLDAEAQAVASDSSNTHRMLTAKQRSERRRSKCNRSFANSIEYQFGGGLEADDWRKFLSPLLGRAVYENMLRRSQVCLDDIFAGESVNMLKLEELFWMDRHRFAKPLRGFQKHRFNYLAVVKIMDFLLNEKRRTKTDKSKPGPTPRRPWLNADTVRIRVLRAIETQINSLHVDNDIARAFLTVIRGHWPDSGKN